MASLIVMHIPNHTESKIRQYRALLDTADHRELTPEERIEAIHLMQQASRELFVQALFSVKPAQQQEATLCLAQ